MDCKNCGAPNPDDAVFCKKCGKRLDGMEVCPACGKLTPADGDFCINCGANKSAPPAPVAAVPAPAAFKSGGAPMQEAAAVAIGAEAEGAAVAAEEFMFQKYRGILKKVSSLCAALTALMGIIFVFLIECSMSVSYSGTTASIGSNYDIFYFFGDIYDEIELIVSYSTTSTTYVKNAYTAGAVFCTVCCAVGMLVTVLCFLAAVARLFKVYGGKTEKGLLAPCAATFISFVCTVALFMMGVSFDISYSGESGAFTLESTAIAGIVLGAIFLAISVATEVMANLNRASLRPGALNGVFSAAMVAFGFVVLGVMAKGVYSDTVDTYSESCGIYLLFVAIAGYAPTSVNNSATNKEFLNMYSIELVFTIVLVIAAIAFCIFLTAALSKILAGKGEDISPETIKLVMIAGLCAVICGAMMLASTLVLVDYLSSNYEASLAKPIVVMVFGVLLVVVAVAYKKRHNISALSPYLA